MSQEPGKSTDEGQKNQDDILKQLEEFKKRAEQLESSNARLLEESKKYKERAQTLQEKEKEEAERLKRLEEEKLREQGSYKQLLEQREKEQKELAAQLEKERSEKERAYSTLTEAKKLSAFQNRLPGKLKNSKLLNFVDTERIVINPDTGEIDPQSVDSVVKDFVTDWKDMVDTGNNRLPNIEGGGSENITLASWNNMSLKDKKANLGKVVTSYSKTKK